MTSILLQFETCKCKVISSKPIVDLVRPFVDLCNSTLITRAPRKGRFECPLRPFYCALSVSIIVLAGDKQGQGYTTGLKYADDTLDKGL